MAVDPKEKHGVRTRFQHQNNNHFCGPACAVMVLDAIHMEPPDQETLYYEINETQTKDRGRGHENWFSSPDGLRNALNNRSGPNHHFTLYASLSQSDIARRFINSISIFKAPCIALVESGIHWIVIYQYRKHGNEPTRPDDFLLSDILGFYRRDPFQEVPSQGFIDYHVWLTDEQFAEEHGFWRNKFVAICDPNPNNNKKGKDMPPKKKKVQGGKLFTTRVVSKQEASDKKDSSQDKDKPAKTEAKTPDSKIPDSKIPDSKIPESKAPDPKTPNQKTSASKTPDSKEPDSKDGDSAKPAPPINRDGGSGSDKQFVSESTAKAYTMWHLETNGFYREDKFNRIINGPQPGEPVLVHNLDTNDFYYITPILENNQQKTGMMRINAKDAGFLEALFAMDSEQPFTLTKLSDQEIKDLLEAKFGTSKKARLISVMPILIWKRCLQSMSRFQPFYKVKMGSKTVYVRIDGKIFSRLTQRSRR